MATTTNKSTLEVLEGIKANIEATDYKDIKKEQIQAYMEHINDETELKTYIQAAYKRTDDGKTKYMFLSAKKAFCTMYFPHKVPTNKRKAKDDFLTKHATLINDFAR